VLRAFAAGALATGCDLEIEPERASRTRSSAPTRRRSALPRQRPSCCCPPDSTTTSSPPGAGACPS
jgi:hypothetical protein